MKMQTTRVTYRLVMAVAATLCLGFTGGIPQAMAEPYTQLLSVRNVGSQEASGYYIPQKMGYFAEEGLEVTMQPTSGGTQEIQLLLAGRGNAGSVSVASLMQAVQAGLKIKGVYLSQKHHGTSLAVLDDGPIKTPQDFKGKNIGTFSTTSSRNFDGQAMVAAAGLDPQKDVSWVPVGVGVQAMTALKNGSVAGLILWDNAYVGIENLGTKLRYFNFPFQDNLVGFAMITSEKRLEDPAERKKIIGYLKGLAKGALFSQVNPDAAACIYMEVSERAKTSKDPAKERSDETGIIKQNSITAGVKEGDKDIGSFPKDKMEKTQQYYKDQGILKEIVSVEEYFVSDPEFYKAINDFDQAKVIADAKNYPSCKK